MKTKILSSASVARLALRLFVMLLLVAPQLDAVAQKSNPPQRMEIVQCGEDEEYEVFYVPRDGQNHYYLSVGRPGLGNSTVQFYLDPASELFVFLGSSFEEAVETLSRLKDFCKEPSGSAMQVEGCVSIAFPKLETERVTVVAHRELLGRRLDFSVERDGYIRMASASRSDISSLLSGLKFHRKLHPKLK